MTSPDICSLNNTHRLTLVTSAVRIAMPRLSYTEAILGPELFVKVRDTPVLVVGAGGIGCELCKSTRLWSLMCSEEPRSRGLLKY